MRRYVRLFLGMFFLCTAVAATGKPTQAQAMYQDQWIASGSGDIEVLLETYDYYSSCGYDYLESTFDDETQSGYGDQEIQQSADPTVDTVVYTWVINYNESVETAWGCFHVQGSITVPEVRHTTYYDRPVFTQGLVCEWVDVVCESGTPACVGDVYVQVPDSSNCQSTQIAMVQWNVVNGKCDNYTVQGYPDEPGTCD